MTVIDMEEARQRLEDKMLQRMRARIQGEIGKAAAAGMPWTPYRPFHHDLEIVGAVLCSSCLGRGRSRTRARRASFVSYSTLLPGRVSTCTWCHAGLGEIADNLTLNMMEALVDAFDDEGRQVSKMHGTVRAGLRRRLLFDGNLLTASGLTARRIVRGDAVTK